MVEMMDVLVLLEAVGRGLEGIEDVANPNDVEHAVCDVMQWPSAAKSIAYRHRCQEEKLTAASRHRREKLTSEECHRDIEERVTSAWADEAQHIKQQEPSREDESHGILQQKPSWADEAHLNIAFRLSSTSSSSTCTSCSSICTWPSSTFSS